MIEHDLKLKKQAMIYCPYRISMDLADDELYYCDFDSDHTLIHLGKKAPYRYVKNLHSDGYDLFMEGLNLHLIAQIRYTDFEIFRQCVDDANKLLKQTNEMARQYLKKTVTLKAFKTQIYQYVYQTNLPLVLKAIEDGAIENSIGMEHPETWTALMFARQHITNALLSKSAMPTEERKSIAHVKPTGWKNKKIIFLI